MCEHLYIVRIFRENQDKDKKTGSEDRIWELTKNPRITVTEPQKSRENLFKTLVY